jgi:hypothetical protein
MGFVLKQWKLRCKEEWEEFVDFEMNRMRDLADGYEAWSGDEAGYGDEVWTTRDDDCGIDED